MLCPCRLSPGVSWWGWMQGRYSSSTDRVSGRQSPAPQTGQALSLRAPVAVPSWGRSTQHSPLAGHSTQRSPWRLPGLRGGRTAPAGHKATFCHPGPAAGRRRAAVAGRPCSRVAGSCCTKAAAILFINSNLPLEHWQMAPRRLSISSRTAHKAWGQFKYGPAQLGPGVICLPGRSPGAVGLPPNEHISGGPVLPQLPAARPAGRQGWSSSLLAPRASRTPVAVVSGGSGPVGRWETGGNAGRAAPWGCGCGARGGRWGDALPAWASLLLAARAHGVAASCPGCGPASCCRNPWTRPGFPAVLRRSGRREGTRRAVSPAPRAGGFLPPSWQRSAVGTSIPSKEKGSSGAERQQTAALVKRRVLPPHTCALSPAVTAAGSLARGRDVGVEAVWWCQNTGWEG